MVQIRYTVYLKAGTISKEMKRPAYCTEMHPQTETMSGSTGKHDLEGGHAKAHWRLLGENLDPGSPSGP